MQGGETSPASAPISGLKLASPTMNRNSKQHQLVIALCKHLGWPAIFYFFITGNPDKPFDSSWCEKILRELIYNNDNQIAGFGLETPLNLYANGVPIQNNKGYDVKVFPVRLLAPASLEPAWQLGQKIITVVNQITNGHPEAIL